MRARRSLVFAAAAIAAALSWVVRDANDGRIARAPENPEEGWFSIDPDGLYHARRLDRALSEGLPVAARDPLLAFPEYDAEGGAPIPWPPYYTLALRVLVGPFAPSEAAARERHVEEATASWPSRFGAATSALVALAAGSLAGPGAALFAGTYHAFSFASLRYSAVGNGDHHAWVSMLHALVLLIAARSLAEPASARRGVLGGAACGLLVAGLLGSWVASLMWVVLLQLALGWAIVALRWERARAVRFTPAGLATFGISLHAAAVVALLPAVLASPWPTFDLVNLSWFHVIELVLGGLVFVPLLRPGITAAALARYPWLVALGLSLVSVLLLLATPLGERVSGAFAWAGATTSFMGSITESQPLLGGSTKGAGALFKYLGFAAPALLIAWAFAAREVFVRKDRQLAVWVVAVPVLVVLALAQRRFADALAAPMAVLLGWGAAGLVGAARDRLARIPRGVWVAAALSLPIAANPTTARITLSRLDVSGFVETPERARWRGVRGILHWIRANTPEGEAVVAQWDLGHLVEWVAGRPTLATNFGSYLGEESWLDPWRFFLARDEAEAEAILERRRARWILVTSRFTRNVAAAEVALGRGGEGLEGTVAGRMLAPWDVGPGVGFARLVHVSPDFDLGYASANPPPCGWVYEHVAGARVEARGDPGQELVGVLRVHYAAAGLDVFWRGRATVGEDGVARLRVPYTTEAKNGDGVPVGPLVWTLGAGRGELAISEADVQAGNVVLIE